MQATVSTTNPAGNLGSSLAFAKDRKAGSLAKLLFVSLAGMIVISILSLVNLYLLRQAAWWRNHSHQVMEQIETIEQSLSAGAAWYQAYRFTKNPGDLWRSDKELATAQQKLATFLASTTDSSAEQKQGRELEFRLKNWAQEASVLADTDRPFVDGASILEDMRKEERRLLEPRTREMEFIRTGTVYINAGMLLFSMASLVFLWRKWNRENVWTAAVLERLYAAEARFVAFMDHSPLLAFITDAQSRLLYSNKAWDRSMGAAFSSSAPFAPNAIPDQLKEHDPEILASGKTLEFVERVPALNNKTGDWFVVKFPFSSDGQTTLLGGLALDVTEFRRTQRAFEESEERLRLALKSGAMHVWELRIPAESGIDVQDYPLIDEGLPKGFTFGQALRHISPEFREHVERVVRTAIQNRGSYQIVFRTMARKWVASSGTVQLDEARRPVRIIGFRQDQTEKIEAEKTLAQLTKLHEAILKSTHVALISIDKNRLVTSWNPAAEKLLGYSAEEVVGHATPDLWLDPEDPKTQARRLDLNGNLDSNPFLSRALLHGEDTEECSFIRKDGSRVLVRLTITPIFDENGQLAGFLEHATDISEFRRASHQVQELNQALQDTVSGWATLDLNGRYVTVNKAHAETTGYATEEMIGLPWQQLVHPDDLPHMTAVYRSCLTTGSGEALVRGLRKDGSIIYQHVRLASTHDYLGNRVGSYWFMRDMTARVEAERKLEASERRYREFFEFNPLPCWTYSPQTLRILDVNEAAVRHYGYSREQFLALTVDDIRIPEEAELMERELSQFSGQPSWTSGPWHHRRGNGELIEVELAACDLSDTSRLNVIRDITEQRQAELIRKSEAKLQEAQHLARLGSWELDTRSGAVSWSPETYRIFGFDEVSGRFPYEEFLNLVHPDDRQQVATAVATSVQRQQIYDLQFRIVRQNGELRHIHGRGKYSNGSRQCLAGTMLDITEEKQIQEALQQSLNEKEVLLKEVHHRVKNNLQVISCLLNLQAASVVEEQAANALRESERRVMAMAVIHERLYGNKRMDRINFQEYAEALTQDLLLTYAPSGSQIEAEYTMAPIELNIEQAIPCGLILNELVTNAIKYAYPAGHPGNIYLHLEQTPERKVRLSVEDHGRGLPENFNWKQSKSLGVTIVNLLTKQLGGTLEIESSRARTAFTVLFPKAS
ncbi:MAG TPA: PAS domain S-box protein [Bryobacteraceae bacterium]